MLNWLERKFGRFAVPGVTQFVVAVQVVMYIGMQVRPEIEERLILVPRQVLQGEVLQLITFLAMPPMTNPLFAFFAWYLFYLMGTALEAYWGTFRYNVFLLIGYVATVAVAFLTPELPVTNMFLGGTVFLAFAYLNPNFELRLFFILPIRIKWLAMFTWITYGIQTLFGTMNIRLTILASVLNFLVFFGKDIWWRIRSGQRQMALQARRLRETPDYFHRCEVCGITDKTHPQMEFRYCSHCDGNRGYCTEHLHNHEHVTDSDDSQDK